MGRMVISRKDLMVSAPLPEGGGRGASAAGQRLPQYASPLPPPAPPRGKPRLSTLSVGGASEEAELEEIAGEEVIQTPAVAAAAPTLGAPSPLPPGAPPAGKEPDTYWDRLIKYIPAEVIALYLSLNTVIQSFADKVTIQAWIPWAAFLVCVLGTYVYLRRLMKVTKWQQLLISVGAFCIWAFAMGGPFRGLFENQPLVAGLLVPIYTFFIPAWEA